MTILTNIKTLITCDNSVSDLSEAAIIWEEGRITWIGSKNEIPKEYRADKLIDAQGGIVIPGLVDCHTHLCFGGWRANEFTQRIRGKSYLEIAQSGGGILSTVKETRASSKKQLIEKCLVFLSEIKTLGITTLEAKSGYGLNLNDEIKILEVYKELNSLQPITIIPTFLGAHTIPSEFKNDRASYINLLIDTLLPMIAERNLASFCDVFVEDSAFTIDEAENILMKAKEVGLQSKLHVDQLSDSNGATLAAKVNAISADHLEFISDRNISKLTESGTVAVMLPYASLCTNIKPLNAQKLIDRGIPVAVATDFNPGSSPSYNLHLSMLLSCHLNQLTPQQALEGSTINAAQAVSIETTHGSLEVGKQADIAVLNTSSIDQWMYNFAINDCTMTIKGGEVIYHKEYED